MCTLWKVSKYGVFSGPYFPVFGLNTEIYEDRIQSEYGKIQSRKNSVFRHFSRSGVLWKAINFLDNIPKYSYIFSQLCLCLCKMNMFLLSSLSSMIIDSTSRWVGCQWVDGYVIGGWLVGGSVVRGFNKTQEKNMIGVVTLSVPFGWSLFCYSNFNFFWLPEAITRISN